MLDVVGEELSPIEKDMLDHPQVGGLILFSRNFHDTKQLTELVQQIRLHSRNSILIAVDHEGGRVQRFRDGFSPIPAMGSLFPQSQGDMLTAQQYAEHFGFLMAAELLAYDIDISFAPVLDIHGISDVIGDRSFHQQADKIVSLSASFIQGMHQAGMKSTGKHFPGHGNVKEDSHVAMPIDKRKAEDILALDMQIFDDINKLGLLDAVMPAHVIYPDVDELPAGFSKIWIEHYLRNKMQFNGVVFSDDLSMQGAVHIGTFAQRAKLALSAGCDMVLVCNHPEGAAQVLDSIGSNFSASERIESMQHKRSFEPEKLVNDTRYLAALTALERFYAS